MRKSKQWLPTRLIDIGLDDSQDWRLCITAKDIGTSSPLPPYISLSYRWGPNPSLLLLTSTIAGFLLGNRVDQLPRTFRELVTVARHLSVRYVWIDALCIMQDSTADWDAEAPTMRMVYTNSLCNIAASASSDENGGLFRSRDPSSIRTVHAFSQGTDSRMRKFHCIERDYWDRNIHTGPLHKRGWVFQERHLSCRVLYFADRQVLFECFEDAKCESFPSGIPHHVSDKGLDPLWQLAAQGEQQSLSSPRGDVLISHPVYLIWRDLVKKYAHCSFTKPADKLPAFAGIAKLFQEITGDEYVGGLWRSRLLEGLDWRVYEPRLEASHGYRAPSWSWGSLEGPFKPGVSGCHLQPLVSLVDVQVRPRGSDPMGSLVGGHVTLRGPLTQAQLWRLEKEDQEDYCLLAVRAHSIRVRIYLDKLNLELHEGMTLYCLPLNAEVARSDIPEVLVLVLLRELDERVISYYRIGHFTLNDITILGYFGLAINIESLESLERIQSAATIVRIV